MSYDLKKIGNVFKERIEKLRILKKEVIEWIGVSRTTLETYLQKGEMPLSIFIELCERLDLEPSTFFLASNAGIIQTTSDSKNVSQTATNGTTEIDLLRQEVKHLKEKIELYERLLKAHK